MRREPNARNQHYRRHLLAHRIGPEDGQQFSFRKFRADLWPIPINELALNPSLSQNPNW